MDDSDGYRIENHRLLIRVFVMKTGFTLIEILMVIVILGIMTSIVVPRFVNDTDSANDAKAQADISTLNSVVEHWSVKNGSYPKGNSYSTAATTLVKDGYVKEAPKAPSGYTYKYRGSNGVFSFTKKK